MKYVKSTFIWFIVLVAVAGYSYLDLESTKMEEAKKEEEAKLLPFNTLEVLTLTIENDDSNDKSIELERWDDGWRIVKPIEAKAHSGAVEKFLKNLAASRNDADYVMDPDPTPERLVEFGLANPAVRVTMRVGRDLKPYTVQFGKRAPTMGVAYARLEGRKAVFRVLADARSEANKDMLYFRNKTVLRINPVLVDQFSITRPEGYILAKLPQDGKWGLEKPVKARTDYNKVFEFLGALANAEISEFTEETKANISTYGLDKPTISLVFWKHGDSEPTVRLDIGKRSPEKRGYYCAMSDRDYVFVLPEETINAIPRHADDLRSRDLLYVEKEKLKRIEVHGDGGGWLVLVKGVDNEWRLGDEKGEKVDFNLVTDFIDEMTGARIKEFVTSNLKGLGKYGLEPAVAQLLFWTEGSTAPVSLKVGKKAPSGYVYAFAGAENMVLTVDERVKRLLQTYFRNL